MSEFVPRAVCYRCDKPQAMCVCAHVPRVDNRTPVLVLQHPRERSHPIGTARLARLGLSNVRVEIAWDAGQREERAPDWLPPDTALLYPAPGARDLRALGPHERPAALLVLDGTWHTARTLYRDKRWLQRLPHVRLSPSAPSRYRLRREPSRLHVSTIEAIVEALRVLEPETAGLSGLLAAFDAMIDEQLVHVLRRAGPRRLRVRRPAAERRLPEAIVSGLSRIVIAYAESVKAPDGVRELVQVSAYALGSGLWLQRQLRLRGGLPEACMLAYMQLGPADFDAACGLPVLHEAFSRVLDSAVKPPIVAAWNQSTLALLARAGLPVVEPLVLKSAYRGRFGTEHASLEDAVAAARLLPGHNGLRGRAAQRMACAIALTRYLHALASQPAQPAPAPKARGLAQAATRS